MCSHQHEAPASTLPTGAQELGTVLPCTMQFTGLLVVAHIACLPACVPACLPARSWVGEPNNWGGGHAGDGKSYSEVAYVSSVKIEPYNQPNDIMYAQQQLWVKCVYGG